MFSCEVFLFVDAVRCLLQKVQTIRQAPKMQRQASTVPGSEGTQWTYHIARGWEDLGLEYGLGHLYLSVLNAIQSTGAHNLAQTKIFQLT